MDWNKILNRHRELHYFQQFSHLCTQFCSRGELTRLTQSSQKQIRTPITLDFYFILISAKDGSIKPHAICNKNN